MKYILLLLLLLIGCSNSDLHDKYMKIKFNQKFMVNDDFYGRGQCTVVSKKFALYRAVVADCVFGKTSIRLTYRVEKIKLRR